MRNKYVERIIERLANRGNSMTDEELIKWWAEADFGVALPQEAINDGGRSHIRRLVGLGIMSMPSANETMRDVHIHARDACQFYLKAQEHLGEKNER